MALPTIGEIITPERARGLCQDFGAQFTYLVERLDAQPHLFTDWVFDGASMLPDALVARIFDIPHLTTIALKHDLKYAYGDPGNETERLRADTEFRQDLIADSVSPLIAEAMFQAVRLGGDGPIKTSFTWGFALKP